MPPPPRKPVVGTSVSPSISFAWKTFRRPSTLNVTLSWVGEFGCVGSVDATAAWPLEMTLSTTTLVPWVLGRPRLTVKASLVPFWFSGVPPVGVKVVSTPPNRRVTMPSGMSIWSGAVVSVAGGGGGRGLAEPEVGHVDRQ